MGIGCGISLPILYFGQGQELLLGVPKDDYKVTIGPGDCEVKEVYHDGIICGPPTSPENKLSFTTQYEIVVNIFWFIIPHYTVIAWINCIITNFVYV